MKALILAAGQGLRLRPLTNEVAKPALPVLGIASIWFPVFVIAKKLGIHEIAVNCGHEPASLKTVLNDDLLKRQLNVDFKISDESAQILGSAGALWKLKDWIGNGPLIVFNGDSICSPDLKSMLEFHRKNDAGITMHLRAFDPSNTFFENTFSKDKYTNISLASDGKITGIGEKKDSGVMFSGVYILDGKETNRLPAGISTLKEKMLSPLMNEKKLFGYLENGAWFDTGTPGAYFQTQFKLLNALPEFKELIELRMQEFNKNIWFPKNWLSTQLVLEAPCVLSGDKHAWENAYRKCGPGFLGISPLMPGMKSDGSHEIVMGRNIIKINRGF